MGDPTNAQDFLDAIEDIMADLGATRKVRVVAYGSIDENNPGAGAPKTLTDYNVEALIYSFDERYIDGTTVKHGDHGAVIDIDSLESSVISLIKPNAKLVDGTTVYTILRVDSVETAGEIVAILLHLRG